MTQKPKKGSSPKAPKVPATSIAKKKSEAEVISGQLDRSVILKAKFDQSGLDAKAQSRAVAALDRLLGGMIGWPAAFFEGKRERAEAKNKIRLEQLLAENMPDKIVHRMLADENRKQENLEGVWAEAEKLLVSPKIAEEPAEYNAETEELADDWMNIFTAYAEKASSERLKQLWGSILSGEIRKPSSFSPTALRIISELDAEIASSFQEIVEYRFDGSKFGIAGDILLRPNPLSGSLLDKWIILEEVGLLQEV